MEISRKRSLASSLLIVAVLLLAVDQAEAAKLKIEINPSKPVEVGKRSCFTGRVTSGSKGSAGARVDLEGKSTRTARNGKFSICRKIHWPGTHAAYAFKGKRTAFDRFRAGSTGVTGRGGWRHMEIQFNAYPQAPNGGNCNSTGAHPELQHFGVATGTCTGWSNGGTDGLFASKKLMASWDARTKPTSFKFNWWGDACPCVKGWIDGPGARIWHVDSGDFTNYDGPGESRITAGSDPAKAGNPGGPWLLKVTLIDDPIGLFEYGYTIHTFGWFYKITEPPSR